MVGRFHFIRHIAWYWLDNLTEEKFVPIFLTAIFPKLDMDDIQGYGLPSQKELQDAFSQILVKEKKNKEIVQTIQAILKIIRELKFAMSAARILIFQRTTRQNTISTASRTAVL